MKRANRTFPEGGRLSSAFRNEKGAIDLASIMVGVIVIGLIGGVVATTTFAIIPWAQDRAAKQQLDSIVTAQSSYRGLSSDPTLAAPEGYPANSYAASTQLASAGLLAEGTTYCTVGTEEGEGYLAVALSGSGKYWAATDDATQPREISPKEAPESCDFVPYIDKTPTLTVMTYKCDTSKNIGLPMRDPVGTATWSDGTTSTHKGNDYVINKNVIGGVEYKVTFDGTYKTMWATSGSDCLISVDHWGAGTGVVDAGFAFDGATKLIDLPAHIPTTITRAAYMFQGAALINDPDISNWNVSNVKDMTGMFAKANTFNQPLNKWDVSNVETMSQMFWWNESFQQPLNDWDVSNVSNMQQMFAYSVYDLPLDEWDVSGVTNMVGMFDTAQFNQPLNDWDVSNVTKMEQMFWGATFNQNINKWNVGKVKNMSRMFQAGNFNQPLNDWNVSNVTNMSNMFEASYAFNQPLDKWNVSKVTNMNSMFENAYQFDQDISKWKTASLKEGSNFAKQSYPNAKLPAGVTKMP